MASAASNFEIIRDEIRRQRVRRNLPPRIVVAEVHRILHYQGCDVEEISIVSADWIKRLESERSARITPNILNALLQALEFSDQQRCELMMLAGYSPLLMADPAYESLARGLGYATYVLLQNPLARQLLDAMFQELRSRDATDDEWLEIFTKIMKTIYDYRLQH